ncbi:thioredoxin domain-containing protein [Agrilactobacillus fermenti]|uniref:thioredoxin domain-containing protein n=1 Tax=Agrilactobacillus fermenti TaxID=2586909 RepID=UPI003A5C66AF
MTEFNFNYADDFTLNYGAPTAPNELTFIFNLGCGDTQKWFLANEADLFAAIDNGQLRAHFKFWNKDKPSLLNGNVANGFIDYHQPDKMRPLIQTIYHQQADLRQEPLDQVAAYMTQTYHLTPYAQREQVANKIAAEVAKNGITSLPTIIKNDQSYFDEQLVDLKQLLA